MEEKEKPKANEDKEREMELLGNGPSTVTMKKSYIGEKEKKD